MNAAAVPGTDLGEGITGIDPRGPRFTAAVTAVLLVVALLLPPEAAVVVVALQTAFFAVGALRGVQATPTAWLFRHVVRPRLSAPDDLEDPRPPRFAQAVGLLFAVVALAGYLLGAVLLGEIAVGVALVAALLNALAGVCVGCEVYILALRARHGRPVI